MNSGYEEIKIKNYKQIDIYSIICFAIVFVIFYFLPGNSLAYSVVFILLTVIFIILALYTRKYIIKTNNLYLEINENSIIAFESKRGFIPRLHHIYYWNKHTIYFNDITDIAIGKSFNKFLYIRYSSDNKIYDVQIEEDTTIDFNLVMEKLQSGKIHHS